MIAQKAGVDRRKACLRRLCRRRPGRAALLGNQVAAGISGYGEFAEQIKAGKLRLLAISADQRQPGIDAPTLKEQGVDIELSTGAASSPLPA